MSESVSNNGESHSGSNNKYSKSSSWSSESPGSSRASSESVSSGPYTPSPKEDKVENIKKFLKSAEESLVKYSKEKYPSVNLEVLKTQFRSLVVDNETSIMDYPLPNNLIGHYEEKYNKLSEEAKNLPENKVMIEGLHNFALEQRKANSKLKYW